MDEEVAAAEEDGDPRSLHVRARHIKKRALKNKSLSVSFNERGLKDFVTGFHKRKKKRRKEALLKKEEAEHRKRIEQRKKMTGGHHGKGKEIVPRRGRGRQILTDTRTMPSARQGVHLRDVDDTEMPSPPLSLPPEFLGHSYVPPSLVLDTQMPSPPISLPPEFFGQSNMRPSPVLDTPTTLDDGTTQERDNIRNEGSSTLQGSSGLESRLFIHPRGCEFSAQYACARRIGKIIESKYTGAWTSYKRVPLEIRDLWFSEFELHFHWREEHSREIRRIFDHVGSHALKNRLYDAKTANRRPPWIPEAVWAALLLVWSSAPYKKTCETNKNNRASICGGEGFPKHFGGSISHLTHRDRLREKLGREPTIAEGFLQTHSKLGTDGERIWSDESSHTRHDAYADKYEPSSSDGSTSTPAPPLSVQIQRWTEMVGGQKKGSVFGLAGLSSQMNIGALTYTPSEREERLQVELDELKTHMQTQTSEFDTMRTKLETQTIAFDAMQTQLATLTQFMMSMQQAAESSPFRPPTSAIPYPTIMPRPPYNPSSLPQVQGTSSSTHMQINPLLSSSRDVDNHSDSSE